MTEFEVDQISDLTLLEQHDRYFKDDYPTDASCPYLTFFTVYI